MAKRIAMEDWMTKVSDWTNHWLVIGDWWDVTKAQKSVISVDVNDVNSWDMIKWTISSIYEYMMTNRR